MLKRRTTGSKAFAFALIIFLNGCTGAWFSKQSPPISPGQERTGGITAPLDMPERRNVAAVPPTLDLMVTTHTWGRLANEFAWPYPSHQAVQVAIEHWRQRPEHFEHASRQAEPYLWFIAEMLASRQLPAELALVPMIESSYQANARSSAGAAGLWQFMPATGSRFGLKQTPWYDARLDIIESTRAALDYLEHLHKGFAENWLLAIAAYNCGPAKVRRAMEKNQSDDFWGIAHDLPRETQLHIPKLLAAIQITRDPAEYGIALHAIKNAPWFRQLDLGGPIDFKVLVTAARGLSEHQFERLNPGFRRTVTDPEGPFRVLVPHELHGNIARAIASLSANQRMPVRTHIVVVGDTLSEISQRFGVGIAALQAHNKLRGNLIRVGDELHISGSSNGPLDNGPSNVVVHHTVRRGDSLKTIGRQYGTTDIAIATLNNLSLDDTLQPGQHLRVELTAMARKYAVAPGDSLWIIARKFNVTVKQLQKWNGLRDHQLLRPGQTLFVGNPVSDAA